MQIIIENKHINYQLINFDYKNSKTPIIVFLHEGLGSIEQWKNFPVKLSQKLKIPALVYDRYGHGKSSALAEKRNINFLFEEAYFLDKLLNLLKISNPLILFGHSDGGTLALIYAAKGKRSPLAVISEAHHIKIEKISETGIKKAIEAFENGKLKKLLSKYHGEKTKSMFYAWAKTWLSEEAKQWNIENLLPNIKVPVLAIQGDKDNYGSFYQLEILRQKTQNVKILLIENCGHIPHLEKQDTIIKEVHNFLAKKIPFLT